MRNFLLTIAAVVLIVAGIALGEGFDQPVLGWLVVVVPVGAFLLRNVVYVLRGRKGNQGAVGRSTDNYNLDARRLVARMRRPLFWVILVPATAVCVVGPLLADPHGPWVVGALCWTFLLWVLASFAVPMLPTDHRLRSFAVRQGLRAAPDISGPTPMLAGTSLHQAGAAQRATEIFTGERAGLGIAVFRLSFEHRSAVGTNLVQFTTIAIDTGIPDFPEFVIDNHEVHDLRQFLPKKKVEKLALEGSFGQRFTVQVEQSESTERRLIALSLVAPDFMALYEDHFAGASLLSQGGRFVLVSSHDLLISQKLLDRYFDGLTTVLRKIDRQVRIRTAARGTDERILPFGLGSR